MYVMEGEMCDRINMFNIEDSLKDNKEIRKYLREHFNNNNPVKTNKKLDELFLRFKLECCMLRMSDYLYNLIKKIYENEECYLKKHTEKKTRKKSKIDL